MRAPRGRTASRERGSEVGRLTQPSTVIAADECRNRLADGNVKPKRDKGGERTSRFSPTREGRRSMSLMMVDGNSPLSRRHLAAWVGATLLTLLLETACSSHAAGTSSPAASSGTVPSSPLSAAPGPTTGMSLPATSTVAASSAMPSAIASTPTPSRTVVSGNKVVVTQADQGKTFQVSIGTIIEFDLHADGLPTGTTVESAHTSDTTILQKLSGSAGPGPTSTAVYRAIGPGTAYVIALITTPCPTAPATPCALAQEAYFFHAQVVPPK